MTTFFLFTPIVLQAMCMVFDEFYFHHKRGLGLWEKVGHPLDTLTVLTCFIFLTQKSYSEENLLLFSAMAFFSCLFVTKDEFVHSELCEPRENWLHAVLFILHPLVFVSAALIWKQSGPDHPFLWGQSLVLLIVLLYQVIYWNFLKRSAP